MDALNARWNLVTPRLKPSKIAGAVLKILYLALAFPAQVDVLLMTQPQSGRWVHFDTEVTNSSGRVTYTIPKSKKLSLGVYPIKMVVK